MIRNNYIVFFSATIVNWIQLLKPERYKEVIIDSLKYMAENKRIWIYAFVIMPNHIHLLIRMRNDYDLSSFQRDFLKFTSQSIKADLLKNHPNFLKPFESKRKDRKYQFWQDRSYTVTMHNRKVLEQKLEYIHNNPLTKKWKLVDQAENYNYSSAPYYLQEIDRWGFITHYTEHI